MAQYIYEPVMEVEVLKKRGFKCVWLISLFSWQDGNGKVSRVIRIGTRKSQVQYFKLRFGSN